MHHVCGLLRTVHAPKQFWVRKALLIRCSRLEKPIRLAAQGRSAPDAPVNAAAPQAHQHAVNTCQIASMMERLCGILAARSAWVLEVQKRLRQAALL